jgi:predicted Fe-Mo cluster-binding NifX family protein
MKVAVPTRGNMVDDHFGHCEAYTIFSIDENSKVETSEMLPSPEGCGSKSNIASVLKEMGVSVMLAGNMGGGALNVLNNQGITVYRGCKGDVSQQIELFIHGKMIDSGEGCHQHEQHGENHVCNH